MRAADWRSLRAIPNTGIPAAQEESKPTFIAVDSRKARLADAVVAPDTVRAHGPVHAGLLQTLVPIWSRRERQFKLTLVGSI